MIRLSPIVRVLRISRWVAALVAMTTPLSVFATERPSTTLDYVRQGKTQRECPDEATFRALVAAKLGYDPFVASAGRSLRVVFRRSGADLAGSLTLKTEGAPPGQRTLHAAGEACDELASSLALAAAVAIDPDAASHPAAEGGDTKSAVTAAAPERPPASPAPPPEAAPAPPPPPVPASRPAPPPPAAASESPPRRLGPRFTGGVFVPVGLTPSVTAGARLGVALDAAAWFVGVEGSGTLESSKDSGAGTVSARLFDAALVPCLRPTLTPGAALALCAVGRFGALRSTATHVSVASPQTDFVASLGPRAGLELFPWAAFGFAAEAELPVVLSRVHLAIDDHGEQHEVWASSRVGMIAALTLIFRPR
jgi:hypothetical protein